MSNGQRQCSNCEFYDSKHRNCRYNPPVYLVVVIENKKLEKEIGWPYVNPDDWCGRFEAKKI